MRVGGTTFSQETTYFSQLAALLGNLEVVLEDQGLSTEIIRLPYTGKGQSKGTAESGDRPDGKRHLSDNGRTPKRDSGSGTADQFPDEGAAAQL